MTCWPPLPAALLLAVLPLCSASSAVLPGVDVFLRKYTHLVRGMRVGLITNQTGRTAAGTSTIDALHRHPDVNLTVLFAPEHGIRGDVAAGEHIDDSRDRRTGLPIVSLYGPNGHKPPPHEMARLGAVIFDMQDVGSRAYTYIWSMAKALEAAAESNRLLIVLDRPNPLAGAPPDGPITEERWRSFIGLYPVPRVYGMTVGELARYINAEHRVRCDLVVIPAAGYRRAMTWAETGLGWTPPSPNIPNPQSAMGFAATGTIGTMGCMDIAIGTGRAFQLVGAPWLDSAAMAGDLNRLGLPGVRFEAVAMVPERGGNRGRRVEAVMLRVTEPHRFLATTTEVAMLTYLQAHYAKRLRWGEGNAFDKAMGTTTVRAGIKAGRSLPALRSGWEPAAQAFARRRQPYLIYP